MNTIQVLCDSLHVDSCPTCGRNLIVKLSGEGNFRKVEVECWDTAHLQENLGEINIQDLADIEARVLRFQDTIRRRNLQIKELRAKLIK